MNQIVTTTQPDDKELIKVLSNSLYPGAQPQSVALVLGYCRAAGLDPMLKPVHIVPMYDKNSKQMRDVIMPGIQHYRVQASRSGLYVGKTEPEFGPDVTETLGGAKVTFPAWCKVTVKRSVGSAGVAEFTAVERWKENYATASRDTQAPNAMWARRPYGQLAKVAEAQALRQAFPELIGGETAEEMEGKEIGPDAARDVTPKAATARPASGKDQLDSFAGRATMGGGVVQGEVLDAEPTQQPITDRGGDLRRSGSYPAMPDDAAQEWQRNRWAKGWTWLKSVIEDVLPHDRPGFVEQHRAMLDAVAEYSDSHANQVEALRRAANGEVQE
jgi:phage recombination protein Bet